MKKVIAVLLASLILLSAMVLPAFAYTKADLLSEASKITVYKYIKSAVENAARNVVVTEEQANALMPLVIEAQQVFAVVEDNGPTTFHPIGGMVYTEAQRKATMSIINRACEIMNWHFLWMPSANPLHEGDVVFYVYDKLGNLIFQYDGDYLLYHMVDTSGSEYSDTTAWLLISAGALSIVAACSVVLFSKRKKALVNGN